MRWRTPGPGWLQAFQLLVLVFLSGCSATGSTSVTAASEEAEAVKTPSTAPTQLEAAFPAQSGHATWRYLVQPGDVLHISVWKEPDLQGEVLVRPDGGLSFPLAGDLIVAGKTVEQLREALSERVRRYVPDAIVTVVVKQPQGHRFYVVGRVNRPGEYVALREMDVMQALSVAGGTTPFASLNKIKILRRENGVQQAIPFRYGDVEDGDDLHQNIVLRSGDVIVVP